MRLMWGSCRGPRRGFGAGSGRIAPEPRKANSYHPFLSPIPITSPTSYHPPSPITSPPHPLSPTYQGLHAKRAIP